MFVLNRCSVVNAPAPTGKMIVIWSFMSLTSARLLASLSQTYYPRYVSRHSLPPYKTEAHLNHSPPKPHTSNSSHPHNNHPQWHTWALTLPTFPRRPPSAVDRAQPSTSRAARLSTNRAAPPSTTRAALPSTNHAFRPQPPNSAVSRNKLGRCPRFPRP